MKTLYTLSTIILMALSINSFADDRIKNKEKSSAVSVAPFIWGDPEADAPAELKNIKAKSLLVPVAPFVWGSPEEGLSDSEIMSLLVPVTPFEFGNPDEDAPTGLKSIKTVNSKVPVAPFVWGNPEDFAL